jgi:hypothetical protein
VRCPGRPGADTGPLTAKITYVRVQIDRFEDNGWAVLLLFPDGRRSFDAPREMLPEGAAPGDVFDVRFEPAREEDERLAEENRRLMDELLGREEQ